MQCPKKLIDADSADAVEVSQMVEAFKVLPIGGGFLDQTQVFWDAHRFYQSERARWESERLAKK